MKHGNPLPPPFLLGEDFTLQQDIAIHEYQKRHLDSAPTTGVVHQRPGRSNMRSNSLLEKMAPVSTGSKAWSTAPSCIAIMVTQHLLLWNALYVAVSTLYVLGVEAVFTNDVPVVVLFLVASIISLFYITLQNITTHLRKNARNRMQSEKVDIFQCLATHVLRILFTIWMVACGLSITFTAARQPLCSMDEKVETSGFSALDRGNTCIVNRVGIISSCVAMLACGMLFILMHKVSEPFRCHLFGFIREDNLLPLFLPYQKTMQQPMYSEMSFKCRSSTSLASHGPGPQWNGSTANLLPSEPARPYGLGIHSAVKSAPSLLHPRPSLASLRSHASMQLPPPPSSPLPPLPAYFPERYRTPSAMQKAIYPPRHSYARQSTPRQTSIRAVPSSPTLSSESLATLNRSNESQQSLSSIYSRSISGERRPGALSDSSRTTSSSSTSKIKRSPLGMMRLAEEPETVVAPPKSRMSDDSSDDDINDVATLQASMKSSRFEAFKRSEREGFIERQSELSRFSCKPLSIRKTREMSGNVF